MFVGASGRLYTDRSCLVLSTDSCIRKSVIRFIEWPWFDRVVLVLICLNCTFLAVQGPPGSTQAAFDDAYACLLYTSPSPRDRQKSRMPSSA